MSFLKINDILKLGTLICCNFRTVRFWTKYSVFRTNSDKYFEQNISDFSTFFPCIWKNHNANFEKSVILFLLNITCFKVSSKLRREGGVQVNFAYFAHMKVLLLNSLFTEWRSLAQSKIHWDLKFYGQTSTSYKYTEGIYPKFGVLGPYCWPYMP